MRSDLYSIGLSGLQSSNARIHTTGQNTSNVDTEGYSRQRTDTVSSPTGGVVLQETSRLVDHFVSAQMSSDKSNHAYYDTYHSMITVSDNLLSEESVSLTTYLNKAFSALQTANNDPTSTSLRELAHASLNNLVDQYETLSSIVSRQELLVDEQLAASLVDLNSITSKISDLNGKILRDEGLSRSPANELRDQQEALVQELSQYVEVKVKFLDNGIMNVQLANGQPLVTNNMSTEITTARDPLDTKKIKLMMDFGKYEIGLKTENLKGSIGGLVDYRAQFSTYADRTLGQHAISIADAMNVQNAKGLDANGQFGRDLFTVGDIQIYTSDDNIEKLDGISVRVSADEAKKITTDSYELIRTDDTRLAINRYDINGKRNGPPLVFDPTQMTPDNSGYYKIEELGLDIRIADLDSIESGDVFRFVPTEGVAKSLNLNIQNGDLIALSAPVAVSTSSENLSNSKISLQSISNTDPATSAFAADGSLYPIAPHTIYFTSSDSFVVKDSYGGELARVTGVSHFNNLLEQAGLAGDAGFDVSVSSRPQVGDEFSINTDQIGPADNFNGLALIELQSDLLVGGKASLTKSFAGFVAYVGTKTAEIEGHAQSSEIVLNDSLARRDRLSAVSLDEEAVNLLKYQQAYSASAQVITAARTTFDTLLGIMR
ncbi:flagellar hook-associated protein FlgK [Marinomonas sp. C2222]|uniref:Flagellar hook-associated protein 1 n=1 Tax=Marinomonas sargassi TaxID=2984494 RepID=A0ABT2YNN6_9GAMM|nr:flagellar hook-associated protein FlgK [Marinomonas sargassi]MCV2401501.1 flagellar hook-associated protein FlgK [Marinomonas sargassi]